MSRREALEVPPHLQAILEAYEQRRREEMDPEQASKLASAAADMIEADERKRRQELDPEQETLQRLLNSQQAVIDAYDRRKLEEMDTVMGKMPHFLRTQQAGIIGIGFAAFAAYVMYCYDDVGSSLHRTLWPLLLGRLEVDDKRSFLLKAAKGYWLPRDYDKDDPYLVVEPSPGLRFINPVGLSAGFDRKATAPVPFFNTGFSVVEVGPADVDAEDGEELSQLQQQLAKLIRRGKETMSMQLAAMGVLGAAVEGSTAKMVESIKLLGLHVDYIALTLSPAMLSPSAKDAITRLAMDAKQTSDGVVGGGPYVFLRVPFRPQDRSDTNFRLILAAGAAAVTANCAGVVLAADFGCPDAQVDLPAVRRAVSMLYQSTNGKATIIVSANVRSGLEAVKLIEAGATLVQMHSLLLTEGPYACRRLKTEIAGVIMREGYHRLSDVIGKSHSKSKKQKTLKNPWARSGGSLAVA